MIDLLKNKIASVQKEEIFYEEIYLNDKDIEEKNEFLFFIKPELTLQSEKIQLHKILELILNKINNYDLKIKNIKVLSAEYLKKYNIISQHYGVINKLSHTPKKYLSENAIQKFQGVFGKPINEVYLLGSFELLEKYPEISPTALGYMAQNIEYCKLAGGTYVNEFSLDGENIFVINSFHPKQLIHFTQKGRSIITFTLCGNVDWVTARSKFMGNTDPYNAQQGSIRNDLLVRMEELGLPIVSSTFNGVHLSAGPIEGLIELQRYNTNFTNSKEDPIQNYSIGKALSAHFNDTQITTILNNEVIKFEGRQLSIFDITEEKNTEEALELLKKYVK